MKKGDRVAQLICERIFHPELVELEVCDLQLARVGGDNLIRGWQHGQFCPLYNPGLRQSVIDA